MSVMQGDMAEEGEKNLRFWQRFERFSFFLADRVFGTAATTDEVYKAMAQQVIDDAMRGVNGTVFAYGQTASGKTHTMRGTEEAPGIVPLAIRQVFDRIRECPDQEFLLRVSYLEIYNEKARDLLACDDNAVLQVRQDPKAGTYVAGLLEEVVVTEEQVEQLLEQGERKRAVSATMMNHASSRSHAIFRMVVESRSKGSAVRVGAINLVDLAGSERLKATQAEGQRQKEGVQINKSLLTLGLVIRKLSTASGNMDHVPYRDSLLTRILQPALGGNSRTAIICNISPAVHNVDESLSTLKFASQAKLVTNVVSVNEIVDEHALLQRYKAQIEDMATELQRLKSGSNVRDLEVQLAQKEDEISRMRSLIVTAKSMHSATANKMIHRETWCAGLDGAGMLSMSMVGDRGAATMDFRRPTECGDEADALTALVLAGSENAATPGKTKKKKEKSKNAKQLEDDEAELLRKRVKELEAELQDAREMQEALEEDNKTLDGKMKELSLRREGGDHELREARDRVAYLVETLQATEDQMVDLRREVELGRAREQQWECTRKDMERERDEQKAKIEEQKTLEEKAMRAEELDLEVTALKWEQTRSAETMKSMEAELSRQREANAELEVRLLQMQELQAEVEEAKQARDSGEKRFTAEAQQTHALQCKLDQAMEQLAARSAELQRVAEERDSLQNRLRNSETTLQQEAMATESQMAGLQSQIRSVASVREKIKALAGEQVVVLSEDETRARYERAVSENNGLKQALKEAQNRIEALSEAGRELEHRRLSNATHKVSQTNWEAHVAEMKQQTEQEDEKARKRIASLEKEITQMEDEVVVLEKEVARLKDADKKLAVVREEKKMVEARDAEVIAQLRSELDGAKSEQGRVSAKELAQLRQELEQARRSAKEELRAAVQKEKEAANQLRDEMEKAKRNSTATAKLLESAKAAKEQVERDARALKIEAQTLKNEMQEQRDREAREREQRLAMVHDLTEAKASLEAKDKEQAALREAHTIELLRKDKKLLQLKELAMEKAKEKLKERDAAISRLKKEKLRISQERDEDMEGLMRQHKSEVEELQKQITAKTEALAVMRSIVSDLQKADENGGNAAEQAGKTKKKETLVKLHNNFA